MCRNPSLGLATKVRDCKVAGQEGSLGVMAHAFGSARECEGIDSHTPRGLLNVQREISGVKTPWIEDLFISLESY
jgi:hypothetical protein